MIDSSMNTPVKKEKENIWCMDIPQKINNKKHFRTQRGEIQEFDLFHPDVNVIPGDRILTVSDIKGAEPNTLMSQAVRNRMISKNLRQEKKLAQKSQINSPSLKQEDNKYSKKYNLQVKPVVHNDSIDELVKQRCISKNVSNTSMQTSTYQNRQQTQKPFLNNKYLYSQKQYSPFNHSQINNRFQTSNPSSPFKSSYLRTNDLSSNSNSIQFLNAMERVKLYNPKFSSYGSNILEHNCLKGYKGNNLY